MFKISEVVADYIEYMESLSDGYTHLMVIRSPDGRYECYCYSHSMHWLPTELKKANCPRCMRVEISDDERRTGSDG